MDLGLFHFVSYGSHPTETPLQEEKQGDGPRFIGSKPSQATWCSE